jgi:hypothetical protein
MFLFLLHVCLHTNLPSCPLHIRRCYLGRNRLVGHENELFCATTEGFVVQSSKRYTNCDGKLNIQTRVGAYNIRLENDGLATMRLFSLPISTFSIFYYPFCFLIDLLSGLSENVLVHRLTD